MVNPERRNGECMECGVIGFHCVWDDGDIYCEECTERYEREHGLAPNPEERERELERQYEIEHGIAPDPVEEAERQQELERRRLEIRNHPGYREDPRGPEYGYGLFGPRPENGDVPPRPGID